MPACGIVKAFHRPEFCPALKTNSRYANGLWREFPWDASTGAGLCRKEYPGLTYAPKNDDNGNPMLPTWYAEKTGNSSSRSGGGGGRQPPPERGFKGGWNEGTRRERRLGNLPRGGGSSPQSIYEPPPMSMSRNSARKEDGEYGVDNLGENKADNQETSPSYGYETTTV